MKRRYTFFTLDEDKNVVPLEQGEDMSHILAAESLLGEIDRRVVGKTQVGHLVVSTVFLCVNHAHDDGPERSGGLQPSPA